MYYIFTNVENSTTAETLSALQMDPRKSLARLPVSLFICDLKNQLTLNQ